MAVFMKFLFSLIAVIFVISIYEDGSNYLSGSSSGVGVAQRSRVLPGADAFAGQVVKAVVKVMKKAAEHTKKKRPSSKGKHERGQSRQKADQERAKARRENKKRR